MNTPLDLVSHRIFYDTIDPVAMNLLKNEEAYKKHKEGLVDLYVFFYLLMYMWKGWLCQPGVGSQMNELGLHRDLTNIILAIISVKERALKEDGGSIERTIHWRDD